MRFNIVDRQARHRSTRYHALLLYGALRELGHTVCVSDDQLDAGAINILLRPELLSKHPLSKLLRENPVPYIIAGTELFTGDGFNYDPLPPDERAALLNLIKGAKGVLCFYRQDLDYYAPLTENAVYTPYGYSAALDEITRQPETPIDVYFFGALLDRHITLLQQLEGRGLSVIAHADSTYLTRNAHLSLAKLVLNLTHPHPFRHVSPRVLYSANNRVLCVSTTNEDPDSYLDFAHRCASDGDLVDQMTILAANGWREGGEAVYEKLRQRPMAQVLAPALDQICGKA